MLPLTVVQKERLKNDPMPVENIEDQINSKQPTLARVSNQNVTLKVNISKLSPIS